MKKYSMPLVAIILIAGTGCKKNNPVYKPPTAPPAGKRWIVSTVAGNGAASFVNGPALSATFHFPSDVAVQDDGIMYVTDAFNFSIRKIVNGGVSNFAGGSGAGIEDGIGTAAKFRSPYSVTLDANGNLYVSDGADPRIRRLSSAREVSLYAGMETPGFADGNITTARFDIADYIISDALGNVYVSDAMNNCIRKISATGQVSTIAGNNAPGYRDGNGAAALFSLPGGIAIDRVGNLYVADKGNFRIRKITRDGDVSTLAGSGVPGYADGNAAAAKFSLNMHDLVIDGQGNLYVADNNRIRKVTPEGLVSTIAGSTFGFNDGDGESAKFNFPNGLGIDGQGTIYVADLNNNRIRKISFE
jgi:streptogramin lyase